jgi:hypothetical protein
MIFDDFEVVSLGLQRLMTTDVYGRNFFLYCHPLRQLINEHQNKIKCLENENNQLKEHVKSSIASVEARYEKFRNVTNKHKVVE